MMNRGENSDSIPNDLILEILSRLPAKSAERFRCVSKLWGSMLSRPYFTNLFLTRSSARPRLLFVVEKGGECLFFSTPQPQNPYGKSSLVVAADFHMKFSAEVYHQGIYTSGLIFFPEMWLSKDYEDRVSVICNPITGQYAILPELKRYIKWHSFFGFDPIDNQFKVLFMASHPWSPDNHRILTLGAGKMRWREIEFPALSHYRSSEGICINGVLYYLAKKNDYDYDDDDDDDDGIVCFDVRSEKFKLVDSPSEYTKLINYKGKLGAISLNCTYDSGILIHELCMCVLEDVEKQEWSKYVYTLPEIEVNIGFYSLGDFFGVTATGEIVLSKRNTCKPFNVFYFNPERNTLLSVEIQALENSRKVYAFVDYVEDLNVNDAKQLKSSRVEQGLNIIRTSPEPPQPPS